MFGFARFLYAHETSDTVPWQITVLMATPRNRVMASGLGTTKVTSDDGVLPELFRVAVRELAS